MQNVEHEALNLIRKKMAEKDGITPMCQTNANAQKFCFKNVAVRSDKA